MAMKKAALVTGGAKRIGGAISRALAEDGYFVHVHYNSSSREADALVADLQTNGVGAAAISADLSDLGQVESLIGAACAQGPAPTVLINSASIFEADHIEDMKREGWQRHLDINLSAPTVLIRDFAARLAEGDRGVAINFLDYKLANLNADFFSYTISKYALKGVTEMLAMALAPKVRVCGLAPGLTLPSPYQSEEDFKALHDRNPLRKGPTVEDHIRAIRFMIATPSYSGQMMMVDGGQHFDALKRDVSYLKT
jgi:NAD(P)-dependent dehydrogenase (short-subunit alcohol dehydrogenase family)